MVPSKIYQEILGTSPPSYEPEVLAGYFVELAKKDPNIVSRIISQFIKKDCELIQKGEMSPNTLPNHVKPIKALLDSNGVPLHWKSLFTNSNKKILNWLFQSMLGKVFFD